jgi:hypothetical protein
VQVLIDEAQAWHILAQSVVYASRYDCVVLEVCLIPLAHAVGFRKQANRQLGFEQINSF